VIGCHGASPDAFAQALAYNGELPEYKDVQRGVHHQDDAERDCGKEKVGRVPVHSVKVAAEKRCIDINFT
jgi:hypothetical protein